MSKSKIFKLKSDLDRSLSKIMVDDLGFEPDEVEDYCRIDIIPSENRVEVGVEVDYEELEMVGERLNQVIEKYDKDAYFEPEAPGITVAYIDMSSSRITADEDMSNDEDDFDNAWYEKFGPDQTRVMTPDEFDKYMDEVIDFDQESK